MIVKCPSCKAAKTLTEVQLSAEEQKTHGQCDRCGAQFVVDSDGSTRLVSAETPSHDSGFSFDGSFVEAKDESKDGFKDSTNTIAPEDGVPVDSVAETDIPGFQNTVMLPKPNERLPDDTGPTREQEPQELPTQEQPMMVVSESREADGSTLGAENLQAMSEVATPKEDTQRIQLPSQGQEQETSTESDAGTPLGDHTDRIQGEALAHWTEISSASIPQREDKAMRMGTEDIVATPGVEAFPHFPFEALSDYAKALRAAFWTQSTRFKVLCLLGMGVACCLVVFVSAWLVCSDSSVYLQQARSLMSGPGQTPRYQVVTELARGEPLNLLNTDSLLGFVSVREMGGQVGYVPESTIETSPPKRNDSDPFVGCRSTPAHGDLERCHMRGNAQFEDCRNTCLGHANASFCFEQCQLLLVSCLEQCAFKTEVQADQDAQEKTGSDSIQTQKAKDNQKAVFAPSKRPKRRSHINPKKKSVKRKRRSKR